MSTYNKALDFAEILKVETEKFPRRTYYLVNRLKKAAGNISTNIAQGQSHMGSEERKNFFWSAKGSIQDCAELIEVAARQGFLNSDTTAKFRVTLEDLRSDVQGLIRAMPQISEN